MKYTIIKQLIAALKCTSCGEDFQAENIEMLGTHGDICMINVYCHACNTKYYIGVVIDKDELDALVDLKDWVGSSEKTGLTESETLTADEVIDMHSFLEGFDGNFSRLFATPRSSS